MKILAKLLTTTAVLVMLFSQVAFAQGNYIPMDPSTLPQVPGCAWYPDLYYSGMYQIWCGPNADETPYQWYLETGIWPPDYGLSGG